MRKNPNILSVTLGILLGGCALASTQHPASPSTPRAGAGNAVEIEYGCGDTVAIGRIKTLAFKDLLAADDLLGAGMFMLKIYPKKILKGLEARKTISATAIAHAQLRADRDFILVLTPDKAGLYTLQSARLWTSRSRFNLVDRCAASAKTPASQHPPARAGLRRPTPPAHPRR